MIRPVVIGIGNEYRRDDGLGLVAAAALGPVLPDADVVAQDGEPTRLIDAWAGRLLAVVVDAAVAGHPPGTMHRVEVGADPLPQWAQSASSHGAGLAAAIHLGLALGRNPARLIVYGIEPADVSDGRGLSPAVKASLPLLLEQVAREIRSLRV